MNRLPNINIPATEKQLAYLKRLTKKEVTGAISKYEAWEKIQRILKERGDPNIKAIKSPSLIEFLTDKQLEPLMRQLGKLSIKLEGCKYDDDFIDKEFGLVVFKIKSDIKINHIMKIEDARDYVELILMNKMKKHFRAKYSIGVLFQQNRDYQVSLYQLFQKYFKQYYPEIEFEITISY